MANKLEITLTRSCNWSSRQDQRETVEALGLRKVESNCCSRRQSLLFVV